MPSLDQMFDITCRIYMACVGVYACVSAVQEHNEENSNCILERPAGSWCIHRSPFALESKRLEV